MNLITWLKEAYFKKFYNIITITIPFEKVFFDDYNIAQIKRKHDNIVIVWIKKKEPLQ